MSAHAYYLAATNDVMGFYCFDESKDESGTTCTVSTSWTGRACSALATKKLSSPGQGGSA